MPKVVKAPRHALVDLLSRREHSQRELLRKLSRRFDPDELNEAIDVLAEEGLQSDHRFAESFTRERMMRGYGPSRIEVELRERGVASAIASTVLNDVPDAAETSWLEQAVALVHRKYGERPPNDLPEKARRMRFLARRGFGDLAAEVVGDPR
ncbi:MAG: regulatory protein RecX [Pseudomonadota bacterium]